MKVRCNEHGLKRADGCTVCEVADWVADNKDWLPLRPPAEGSVPTEVAP